MCYDSGLLQAYLDQELKDSEREEIDRHLANCVGCQEKLQQLMETQQFTDELLSNYFDSLEPENQDEAWFRLQQTLGKKKGVLYMLKKYRGVSAAAAVVLAVSLSLSFAPVRAMASDLLSIFRVNNFQTVTINNNDLAQIQKAMRDGAGKVTLGDLGQVDMKQTGANGEVTLAEAKGSVDFPLLLPQTLPSGYALKGIQRMAGTTLDFTLDTHKTNDVLKSFGATTLLPDEINGKAFTATIPVVISASYNGPENHNLTISQTRGPQLTAPTADVNSIRDAILALPFLPDNLRKQLASVNDWQHTFVIPSLNGSTQTVTVAGSQGVFISAPQGTKETTTSLHNALLWQKDGVIYAINGNFTLEQGLALANSLK
ncbi:anti-sigma factor family protein [Desulfosporosinus sp. SB140]|uniref:anti-sigma factor family protein n=1 Tax=Desulfosporosinus paludis TaxID=3115649 RepID=UPI00388D5D98